MGTHLFGRDINRLREAIGVEKLNFNVVSYGTAVGSVFAAMYPQHVDKLLLNANMPICQGNEEYFEQVCAKQHSNMDLVTRGLQAPCHAK